MHYFPDEPLVVLQPEPNLRVLVVAGITTHLLTGPSFEQLTPVAEVLRPGGRGSSTTATRASSAPGATPPPGG